MDFTAPHLGFVLASYGISAALILGLVFCTLHRDRSLRAEAERLDRNRRKASA